MDELYIGVMSGTSLDGIDITLCSINNLTCKLIHSAEYHFPRDIKDQILKIISNQTTLLEIGELNIKLGLLYADSINNFLQKNHLNPKDIEAIGLHGQTLWHSPDGKYPFSMQLGCPNILHAKTQIKVVGDFRSMDIANGGQGAPFTPAFHQFVFAKTKTPTAVLNIGGMANLTLLGETLKGWDTGCGNVLLDLWVSIHTNKKYDENGEWAKSGTIHQELLNKMLDDEYFKREYPKSTGREYFNQKYIAKYLRMFKSIKNEDIQRTLLELTAKSIANDINKTDTNILIICGGGAKNSFLIQRLQDLCDIDIILSDKLGIDSDFMESMAFAWLAYKRVHKEKVNLCSVTGAKKDSILGGIYG
jgi:anhydro-N-acetylmuramic acid kinase